MKSPPPARSPSGGTGLPRVPLHRALALVALGLALATLAPGLVALGEDEPHPTSSRESPTVVTRAPDAYVLDLALGLDAAGVQVSRGLGRAAPDPRTTLAPEGGAAARLSDLAADLPADASLGVGLAREDGAVTSHAVGPAAVAAPAPAGPVVPPAVAAGAAAGFALLSALLWAWPHVKKWALLALYAHIGRAEALENGVRERIFEIIRAEPGVHASDLAEKAGVSWGTAMYHLDVLERCRMVVAHKDGRYRRYFANGAAGGAIQASVLCNPRTATVRELLLQRPGLTQRELSEAAGMTPQALHWHVARLETVGLVRKVREGRTVRHYGG